MSWLWGKGIWLVLISSLAFNAGMGTTFGVRAYNRHYGRPWGPPHKCRHRAFLERLNLRPDQLGQVEAEGEALHAEMRGLHRTLADESAALADLLVAVEPDREAIAAQLDKLADMHKEKQQQVVEHFLRLNELLNDDQREAFAHEIRRIFMRSGKGPPGGGRHHGLHRGPGPRAGKHWHRNDDDVHSEQ
ncbi:MAG: Spy/CpxP family protein refolding chaperone [Planctomycetota bacterium]|jgi:Spy/CpxP family protein refolding chaperone